MSWISDLAGKAENLLNAVDQTAAKTLQQTSTSSSSSTMPYQSNNPHKVDSRNQYAGEKQYLQPSNANVGPISSSTSVPANLNRYTNQRANSSVEAPTSTLSTSTSRRSTNASPATQRSNKPKDRDEELFEFLNSDSVVVSPQNSGSKAHNAKEHSRQSSTSSLASQRSTNRSDVAPVSATMSIQMDRTEKAGTDSPDHIAVDLPDEAETNGASSGYHSTHEDSNSQYDQGTVSSLELENRLLKNEIASLNQEMSTVIERSKNAQDELSKLKQQQQTKSAQLSQSDQMIRELQSRESDLLEALGAKDSQLAVLRIRIEEGDKELVEKRRIVETMQNDRDRILADHTSSSDVHNQALESLKNKLTETEILLQREKDAAKNYQEEAMKRQSKFETEQQNLAGSLATAQKKLTEQKARFSDLNVQLKTAKSQADAARQDLIDYKDKAARILASKDKLIGSLKEGSHGDGDDTGVSFAELEELRHDRDMLKDELQQARVNMQQLRMELQETEIQLQTESDNAHEEVDSLEEQLNALKQSNEELLADNTRQKQELRFAHEELLKQKTSMQSRLDDRDAEIDRLRKQLMTKSVSSTSESELENRLHSLTESLIHKQTMLEALSTEKNSLTLQLERMEKQYQEAQAAAIRSSHPVQLHEDDEVRPRLPAFLKESPGDSNVIRKVKRTAGTVDRFSIRLGVFLRRYPIARVFVIVYMALLHLWVTLVMLTYQPEMHGPDYLPHEQRPFR